MPTPPVDATHILSVAAVDQAIVSAAGNHIPVSAVPVVETMAGSAALPAATVVTPVTPRVPAANAPM